MKEIKRGLIDIQNKNIFDALVDKFWMNVQKGSEIINSVGKVGCTRGYVEKKGGNVTRNYKAVATFLARGLRPEIT